MKAQLPRILPMALAVLVASGGAFAQAGKPNTGPHTTFGPATTTTPTTSTQGNVTINTSTGVITNADGTVVTLGPGQVVFVTGTTVTAGSISGVIVSADSTAVRALLGGFAGSSANLTALEQGLINRTTITLTGPSGNVSFTSPVVSMTQADATQALLIASSQLGSLGIAQPTPQQVQAALVGGTVSGSTGQSVALTGVLQMRRQGLSFAQIAQTIGAQAGLNAQAPATPTTPGAAPALTGREPARGSVASGQVRRDGAMTSTPGTTGATTGSTTGTTAGTPTGTATGTSAATAPATGTASSAPPAGSASATRGNPSATGGAGLR